MQAALEQWRRDAESIPNVIRRLQYAAALRNRISGLYYDPWLAPEIPQEEMDAALRRFHEDLFRYWVSLSLCEQNRELVSYLSAFASHAPSALRSLAASWARLVPVGVADFERRMYLIDFAVLVELVREKFRAAGTCDKLCPDRRGRNSGVAVLD